MICAEEVGNFRRLLVEYMLVANKVQTVYGALITMNK